MNYLGMQWVRLLSGHISSTNIKLCFKALLANASLAEALDRNFEEYAPICFQYERDTENSKYISRELRKFYFGSRHINNSTLPQLANLFREAIITFPVKRSARLLAEYSDQPIYFYKFQYQGRYSFIYSPENSTTPYGKRRWHTIT